MATIAELMVRVGVLDDVQEGMAGAAQSISRGADKMVKTGGAMTRKVTMPLAAAGAGLFALAGAQEDAEVKMTSSFDSMGAAAWTTTDALKEQASAFQELSTFGDESILEMQSVLLTFGNVTDDVFTDATRLGLDMSAKLGTDLQSSAIQLGKALNDPVKGVTALTRVGVSFTEEQIDMIKSMSDAGDTAGAQALILGELEKQFGGTAEAMAQTGTGKAKQAMNALGDAGEQIGAIVIPMVSKLAEWLKKLAGWFQNLSPEAKEWIVRLGAVAAAVGPVLLVGGKLIKGFMAVGKAFKALNLIMMANPWALLIAAVVALVVVIVKNWDKIVEFLQGVWDWIKEAAGNVWEWLKEAVGKALEFIKDLFLNWTGPGLVIKHWDSIKAAAKAVWDWIKDFVGKALDFVKNLFLNWTAPGLIIKHWDSIKEAATAVGEWIKDKFNAVVEFFKGIPGRISRAVSGMWDGIKTAFKAAVNWLIGKWNNLSLGIGPLTIPSWIPGIGGRTIDFRLNTPNIPYLHDGGIYRAPPGQTEGLAMLEDGERVIPADGARQGAGTQITIGNVYGWDDFVRKVREAGVDIQRLGLTG